MTRILLLSGSTRRSSTNTAALLTMVAEAPSGVEAALYEGLAGLPAFNPDDDHEPLPLPVAALRAEIDRADAVVVCTPEYAGTLPGSFKNLLDWCVGGTEISGRPVAWVNVAALGRGTGALSTLSVVLGYVGASVVEPACLQIPVSRGSLGADGLVDDPAVRARLRELLDVLVLALPQLSDGR